MEGQHAADKLLSINRPGIRRGIYIFRLPVSFATRRVFFLLFFFLYSLVPRRFPFTIPLFRGVEVVFSETRRWHVVVGPSNRYLACRAQCHGVIHNFSLFRGRLEKDSFLIESPVWATDGLVRKGDFGFSIASPSFVLVSC